MTKFIGGFIAIFGFILLIALIMALPTMLLWNYCLVGAINGVNHIGFFSALGINILSGILFKSTSPIKKEKQ